MLPWIQPTHVPMSLLFETDSTIESAGNLIMIQNLLRVGTIRYSQALLQKMYINNEIWYLLRLRFENV